MFLHFFAGHSRPTQVQVGPCARAKGSAAQHCARLPDNAVVECAAMGRRVFFHSRETQLSCVHAYVACCWAVSDAGVILYMPVPYSVDSGDGPVVRPPSLGSL